MMIPYKFRLWLGRGQGGALLLALLLWFWGKCGGVRNFPLGVLDGQIAIGNPQSRRMSPGLETREPASKGRRFTESETVELKPSLSQINEIVETAAAFANAGGGRILIGVSRSGKVLGVQTGKDTIERLSNKIASNTDPPLYPGISVKGSGVKGIIEVAVGESREKPVLAFGRAFKRVGKSTIKVDKREHERMVLERNVYFDSLVCEDASLDDLDSSFVNSFFVPRYEGIAETKMTGGVQGLLESLGCIKHGKPTNAGILLFGDNPQEHFMNGFIALARYKGKREGRERLDYKEFNGNIFQQIDKCDKYIKEHVAIMSRLHAMKVEREDIPEYPLFSIRELIMNAVCHRDYSDQGSKVIVKMFEDHMEFYNPGGLPKEITAENILEKQFSRNPTIAKVLSKIRYVEELGEGWNKIIDEHKKHALRPKLPKISADRYSMLVKLFSTKGKFEEEKVVELSERQKRAIEYLRKNIVIDRRTYMSLNKVSNKTAFLDLDDLVCKGVLEKAGRGRAVVYRIRGND